MRRLLALVLFAVVTATAGCSGADAERAQELLARSQEAMNEVKSFRFSARIWTSGAPKDFSMTMRGGGYAQGRRAGDFFLEARADGIPALSSFSVLSRDGVTYANLGSGWTQVPTPAAQSENPLAGFDFTPYIKNVRVEEGILIGGEPTAKITGVIDTSNLLEGALGQLSQGGAGGFDLSHVFGDIRAVLYVSETNHLALRGLIDFPIELLGERVEMHMDFALAGVNEPVRIPTPT